jgi:hypothetical protein
VSPITNRSLIRVKCRVTPSRLPHNSRIQNFRSQLLLRSAPLSTPPKPTTRSHGLCQATFSDGSTQPCPLHRGRISAKTDGANTLSCFWSDTALSGVTDSLARVLTAQIVGTRVQLWALNNSSFIYGADDDQESRALWAAGRRYAVFWVLRHLGAPVDLGLGRLYKVLAFLAFFLRVGSFRVRSVYLILFYLIFFSTLSIYTSS